ncbi:MAG: DUF2752 domain-containing protein [Myxococcota bacterium]
MTVEELTVRVDALVARVNAVPEVRLNRVVGLLIGAPSSTVLALAAWLTPSPAGYGTHVQLGLGSCTMLTITGWPCPMCGMTTTFAHVAHLHFLDALANQPFGLVLFALTVLAAGIGVTDLATGRGLWRRALGVVQRYEQKIAIALLAGMIAGWLYKCAVMHPEVFS